MNIKNYSDMHGFRVVKAFPIDELSSTIVEMEHIKSGARLVFHDRKDDNKTFAIAFPTPPRNDKGVSHILEHCVLSGSKKFPVKDPFTQLLKTSIYSQLNAYTYNDRTVFPIASKNDKSFLGLIDVYMDAVLHPLLLQDKSIFLAEGCRIEKTDDGVEIGGVVYNEMLGAYSSSGEIMEHEILSALYSGGTHAFESGGHPDAIPTLTYEELCQAHREFYHPSFACICLDGSVNLDEVLPLLNSYLSEYERREGRPTVVPGKIITEPITASYHVESDPERADKLALSYLIGPSSDNKLLSCISIAIDAIADDNTSPLVSEILKHGLCEKLTASTTDCLDTAHLTFSFTGVKRGKREELTSLFDTTIRKILSDGIPKEKLSALYNLYRLRDKLSGDSASRGMNSMYFIITAMIYDEPLEHAIYTDADFIALKEEIDAGRIESTLLSVLDGERASILLEATDAPSEIGAEGRAAARERLAKMTDEEYSAHLSELRACQRRLLSEDTEEAIATLPRLTREDIKSFSKVPLATPSDVLGATLLSHSVSIGGITSMRMLFDASDLTVRELQLLELMSYIYDSMDTELRDVNTFRTDMEANGGVYISTMPMQCYGKTRVYLSIRSTSLIENREKMSELLLEYALKVKLDDTEKLRREIEQKYTSRNEAMHSGSAFLCSLRAMARYHTLGAVREYIFGYENLKFLRELGDASDEELCNILAKMRRIRDKIMVRERMTLSIASEKSEGLAERIIGAFPSGASVTDLFEIPLLPMVNEGFSLNRGPSHTAMASNLSVAGLDSVTGGISLMNKILNYEYLWDEVRSKGGAYGTDIDVKNGSRSVILSSFRDPSPERTLEIFRNAPKRLREILASDCDLMPYVISIAGNMDVVETIESQISDAIDYFISGISDDDRLTLLREVTDADADKLTELSYLLEKMLAESTVCVAAPREELEKIGIDTILE